MKKLSALFFLLCFSLTGSVQAQPQSRNVSSYRPTFTYDLGASTGTYADLAYSEIQFGVNWFLQDYLAWRNALFTRFGSEIESASGLDTSLRFLYRTAVDERGFSIGIFAGPGLRISDKEHSGMFAEAGLTVRSGGFAIGGGVKSISYSSPGQGLNGRELAKSDTVVFLILAAGGAF